MINSLAGWEVVECGDEYHIFPILDGFDHKEALSCLCKPTFDEKCENVIIHNSFDGRELTEYGLDVIQ